MYLSKTKQNELWLMNWNEINLIALYKTYISLSDLSYSCEILYTFNTDEEVDETTRANKEYVGIY